MPVRKKTSKKNQSVAIDETIKHALLHGPGSVERGTPGASLLAGRHFDDTQHRDILATWVKYREPLLTEWARTAPGVRPWVVEYLNNKATE